METIETCSRQSGDRGTRVLNPLPASRPVRRPAAYDVCTMYKACNVLLQTLHRTGTKTDEELPQPWCVGANYCTDSGLRRRRGFGCVPSAMGPLSLVGEPTVPATEARPADSITMHVLITNEGLIMSPENEHTSCLVLIQVQCSKTVEESRRKRLGTRGAMHTTSRLGVSLLTQPKSLLSNGHSRLVLRTSTAEYCMYEYVSSSPTPISLAQLS